MAFKPRLTAPSSSNRYYYKSNPFYQAGYGIPNCTCYAYGRFWEISGTKPKLSLGDAENWYSHSDGYERGQTPKLGAVICLGNGPYSGFGHVAVVEKIKSNGTVVCSNSAWGGSEFYLVEGNASNNYGYSEYDFHGFIYNPAVSGSFVVPTTWVKGNYYLNEDEMENNAIIIYDYLTKKGWSMNAICGLLGNLEVESTINPGIWQNLNEGYAYGGFGLVQWTPSTKYTDWAKAKGYSITNGYKQLDWINSQTVPTGQWIETTLYPYSFEEFKTSDKAPEVLAQVFLKNFERAGVEAVNERSSNAVKWYEFLNLLSLMPGSPLSPDKDKKRGYNFVLFNAQKRRLRRK